MDSQTAAVEEKPANAYQGMRQNVAILAQDAVRLADLQLQLLTLDITEFWQRARFGIAFCIVGAVVMLGAVPVLLLSLAELLTSRTDLSLASSQGLVAVAALILAAGVLWMSLKQLTHAGRSLQRSQEELRANMTWLRSVLNGDED